MFGKVVNSHNHLLARLDELAAEEKMSKGLKWGMAYRKFYVRSTGGVQYAVDVFVAKAGELWQYAGHPHGEC
ncbi:MAG: hypothetical protein IPL28_10670 [Chloroflexi bacterium]|nr:hypothetical protein [Chloroflexota bacterium]